ncbi:hypothetical protein [Streptosporangium longisporum]|uniref:hypothetical protein n=1 Tax=Streptosporangium longisporum TaxID=46187 RepID=UPI0031ED29B8
MSTPLAAENEQETYALTLRHTGRDGAPTPHYLTTLRQLDGAASWRVIHAPESGNGSVTLRLPRGRWAVYGTLTDGEHTTHLVHPDLDLSATRTLELDARLGRPVSVTVPDPSAVQLNAQVSFDDSVGRRIFLSDRFENMATAQLGPDRTYDDVVTGVAGTWTHAGTGGTDAGARTYRLAWFHDGGMITGFHREVARRDLATIHTDHAAHLPGRHRRAAVARLGDGRGGIADMAIGFTTPSTYTEYVNGDRGARWQRFFLEDGPGTEEGPEGEEGAEAETVLESPPTRYTPGRVHRESWNRGVFGPVLTPQDGVSDALVRSGGSIRVDVPMYGDGAGHSGTARTTGARVALYRDGDLITERPGLGAKFTVPAEAARYRLVVEAERGAPATLSTRLSVAWTFRSEEAEGTVPLPVSVVRFSPPLDARNTAPGGVPYRVPVTVQAQPGSAAGTSRDLVVEVSYDDGATWSRAPVHGGGAVLRHPAAGGFASLRATSTDTAGNTVEQTVIRAYRIVPANRR